MRAVHGWLDEVVAIKLIKNGLMDEKSPISRTIVGAHGRRPGRLRQRCSWPREPLASHQDPGEGQCGWRMRWEGLVGGGVGSYHGGGKVDMVVMVMVSCWCSFGFGVLFSLFSSRFLARFLALLGAPLALNQHEKNPVNSANTRRVALDV